MSGKRIAALTVVALLAAAALLSGCVKPTITPTTSTKPTTVTTTPPAETTQTSVEPNSASTVDNSGPITTPGAGTPERKALLDAAREKLGTSSQFYVYQLYAQGDTALGDLETLDNSTGEHAGRIFVAWEMREGVWTAIGVTKFGSASANAVATARALPSFSDALINKIDWKLDKAKPSSGPSESSVKTSLSTAAKAQAKTDMEGKGTPYKVTTLKVAKDTKGNWWGRAVVQPSPDGGNNYEALDMWCKYSGGAWTCKTQDPEPPAPSTFFPSSVISKLGL